MASVDPEHITDVEVAGIGFSVREMKSSSRKHIAKTLEAIGKQKNVVELIDMLAGCAFKYVVGWKLDAELTQDTIEDVLDVSDLIALLRTILMNGILSVEDKKKSESPHSSKDESSATDALDGATETTAS